MVFIFRYYYRIVLAVITMGLLAISLGGCAWLPTIFHQSSKARQVEFTFQVDGDVNPHHQQRPTPIAVTLLALKDNRFFKAAQYDRLTSGHLLVDNAAVLNQHTWVLWPDSTVTRTFWLPADSQMVGVAVGYRLLNNKQWKLLKPAHEISSKTLLHIQKKGATWG